MGHREGTGWYSPVDLSTEELRECRAIRVKYDTDEGFGRYAGHDDVFIVHGGRVLMVVGVGDFQIGKPGR